MKKGRSEIFENSLDIEKKAKRKAIKTIVLIVLFVIIFFVVLDFIDKKIDISLMIAMSIYIIILLYIGYFILVNVYKEQEIEKINSLLVEGCISTSNLIEVIPINAYHHKEFILALVDIAKFYAKINKEEDEYVEVWVILNKGSMRFLENVYKGCFFDYYSIVEENKKNEKY